MDEVKFLGGEPTLFLDISSTCTGYVVATYNIASKVTTITKAGVLWFHADWEHGQKYRYIQQFITDIAYVHHKINDIVAEKYFCNPKAGLGTAVVSEATGAAKAACYEVSPPLSFYGISPPTWRSILQIKKDKTLSGSAAWKTPTKTKVEAILGITMPVKIVSNINGKGRQCPTDLWDALAICIAWTTAQPNGATKFILGPNVFDVPVA